MFIQQILNGLTVGGVYALIALGYTMVYGILKIINFAHGEIYMIGAYFGIIFIAVVGCSLPVAALLPAIFVFAMLYTACYGFTMEKIGYQPIRKAPRLSLLIAALGMSIFFQNYVMVTQGARDKVFPHIISENINYSLANFFSKLIPSRFISANGSLRIINAQISFIQLLIILTSIILMLLLNFFITRTRIGKAMRATSQDIKMAGLIGINVDRIISITFIIGSALAAAAGVMVAIYYGRVHYFIGYVAGIKAFTAAVLGGIGNIYGAMAGGLILGLVECLAAGYISCEYKDVYAFIILILILIFRPQGLLGKRKEGES